MVGGKEDAAAQATAEAAAPEDASDVSLCLFGPSHDFRVACAELSTHSAFDRFIVGLIVVSVAGAVVNRPPSGGNDPYIYNNAGYGSIDKFTSDGQPLEFGSRY